MSSIDRVFNKRENKKIFGKYRAIVKDINDPEKLGRIKVECSPIYGNDLSPWTWPCLPYGGLNNTGMFFIPEVGSGVWIEFEQGSIDNPIWTGVWWTKPNNLNEVPNEARTNYGASKIIKTKSGHVIELNDNGGILIKDGSSGVSLKLENGMVKILGALGINNASRGIARKDDTVEVNIGGTIYTGKITSASNSALID